LVIKKFLIAIVTSLVFIICFHIGAETKFNFVVLGDSQLENEDVFERIVRETELLKPCLVLHVGDMITGYTYQRGKLLQQWDRFKEHIEPLTMPFYPVVGNHDITTTETETIYQEIWGNDRLYYSVDYEGTHFVFLNTSLHARHDTMPDEEVTWLKKDLEEHQNAEHIFITFHSPLYLNSNFDWEPFHGLFTKYPVHAVFTGHYHIFDHLVRDGIHYFSLNSSGTIPCDNLFTGYAYQILYVTVCDDNISYAVKTDDGIFAPEVVSHGEYLRSRSYIENDGMLIIPNTKDAPIQTTLEVPLNNRTNEAREYTLKWKTHDFRWSFDPRATTVTIEPGLKKNIRFTLSGPQGIYTRSDLPRLQVESPYINSAGYETILQHKFHLFYPPETTAVPLKETLLFDGSLDKKVWEDVPAIESLFLDKEGTPASQDTLVKVLYDTENIYVGIKGEEPNPVGLVALAHGEFPLVFADDCYEVYIDPGRTMTTFYRFSVNPKGTTFCRGPKGYFTVTFDVKTYVGDDYWSAEFKIPYTELDVKPPGAGSVWGLNIRRGRTQADPSISEWSRMRGWPAQPQLFGILNFQ